MTRADAKKLIGKKVEWLRSVDRHRGSVVVRGGVVEEVAGWNIRIDGDWKWIKDLTGLREQKKGQP